MSAAQSLITLFKEFSAQDIDAFEQALNNASDTQLTEIDAETGNSLLHLLIKENSSRGPVSHQILTKKFLEAAESQIDSEQAFQDLVNLKNQDGQTALHIAVLQNDLSIPRLLSFHADPAVPDNDGNTALHLISKRNRDYPHTARDLIQKKRTETDVLDLLNIQNNNGLAPEDFAKVQGKPHTETFLREQKTSFRISPAPESPVGTSLE